MSSSVNPESCVNLLKIYLPDLLSAKAAIRNPQPEYHQVFRLFLPWPFNYGGRENRSILFILQKSHDL